MGIAGRPEPGHWKILSTLVRTLRTNGFPVFFTIDAGPQVKVFCKARARADVVAALEQVPGVEYVIVSGLGSGVEIL